MGHSLVATLLVTVLFVVSTAQRARRPRVTWVDPQSS